ncbi:MULTISPECIES: nucleotidyltransferase family protein [Pseudomonas]|uniref:Molybdenum cofactor cytidylyltransferase n=1 Tax=Pseudomonas hunanensis TaxID=1247546 RepID=A0ACC6JXP0_9PSED|nr:MULTISPECIES: nucleotidyltransferase family protein [Pseudomonas]MBP2262540.1 molybdenum cofactor cytidylyltransferase [Pseudomonas sp. BP8]MDR6710984.1 molybdenum cofactor cytidylyltransferase [Pseudomonas hunanensis]HDS1733734.1 nucleotidyltransferase family protein [Pseudomonas putida]
MACTAVALVLAAGRSQRFGGDKRHHPLGNGQTLLQTSLTLPCTQLDEVWLALREDDPIPPELPRQVRILQSSSSRLGLGHSIAASVARISQASDAQALVLLLGDMPFIQPATLAALLADAQSQRICRPAYHGTPGHPVVFGRAFWAELAQLQGDQGARVVVQANRSAVHTIAVDDPGVLRDIDRPSDLPGADTV